VARFGAQDRFLSWFWIPPKAGPGGVVGSAGDTRARDKRFVAIGQGAPKINEHCCGVVGVAGRKRGKGGFGKKTETRLFGVELAEIWWKFGVKNFDLYLIVF
jgi:hypothetical protein